MDRGEWKSFRRSNVSVLRKRAFPGARQTQPRSGSFQGRTWAPRIGPRRFAKTARLPYNRLPTQIRRKHVKTKVLGALSVLTFILGTIIGVAACSGGDGTNQTNAPRLSSSSTSLLNVGGGGDCGCSENYTRDEQVCTENRDTCNKNKGTTCLQEYAACIGVAVRTYVACMQHCP
jgi:hypothetical protein